MSFEETLLSGMNTRAANFFVIASISGYILMSLTSCATDSTPKPPHAQRQISTMPQNMPESWEGGSPFGGFGQSR